MLATLEEAKNSALKSVASACANSPAFVGLVNEATRMLMRRGDWEGTVVPIYLCAKKGCITFPRYVKEVRKANLCNNSIPVNNGWYKFLDFDAGRNWQRCSWYGWQGMGVTLNQTGSAPTFSDIYGDGRLVRVYAQANADIGKTVRLFGVDNNNQPLSTQNNDGTWTPGITITIASPFGSSAVYVRRIDRVLKDETTGPITMFAYNVAGDVLEELASYEPSETNPVFTRFKMTGGNCGEGDCVSRPLIALVKLRFVPVVLDTDLVLIDNLDALKNMIQSIKYAEAGDDKMADKYEARAIRELNMGLRDGGDDLIPVSIEPFSGIPAGRQKMW